MNIKLDNNTPNYLAPLFTLFLREGITPNQIMVGIVQLATNTNELEGMMVAVDCLRLLLAVMPIDTSAEGISEYISSLTAEGVTTLMLLDALAYACQICELEDAAKIIHLTYQRLEADKIISQVLGS
jgi:hypothetical protein